MGNTQKIVGARHSILKRFIPFLESLDAHFGEKVVSTGRFRTIKNRGDGLVIAIKGYDHSKKVYSIQVKEGGEMQYFNLSIEEHELPALEHFVRDNYPNSSPQDPQKAL